MPRRTYLVYTQKGKGKKRLREWHRKAKKPIWQIQIEICERRKGLAV